MDDKLLGDVCDGRAGSDRGSYGSSGQQPESLAATPTASGGGRTDKDRSDSSGWTWTKRLRLQRHPSFGTVEEDRAATKNITGSGECSFLYRSIIIRCQQTLTRTSEKNNTHGTDA